jgi:hypothetical protein
MHRRCHAKTSNGFGSAAKNVAEIIGCDTDTITNWENGADDLSRLLFLKILQSGRGTPPVSIGRLDQTAVTNANSIETLRLGPRKQEYRIIKAARSLSNRLRWKWWFHRNKRRPSTPSSSGLLRMDPRVRRFQRHTPWLRLMMA